MSKSKKIEYLEKVLCFMARAILKKYNPKIVGITGSIGKSSAKEAVALVLATKFTVRQNQKNYNNEIGLPLTVLGSGSGQGSLWKWLGVFLKWAWSMIFTVKYPEILVLEMGVDRPGDMKYLLSFIRPTVGVVTNISSSHLEFFRNLDHIAKEKGRLVEDLPREGVAVLSADDTRTAAMAGVTGAEKIITFGFGSKAELKAINVAFNYDGFVPEGLVFKMNYDGKVIPVRLPNILAPHIINAALVGAAVGSYFKINLAEIANALQAFRAPEGRMNLIQGIKGSFLIDDTYNASPSSTVAALDVLQEMRATRKIAVLGDMLELGEDSQAGHERVAQKVYDSRAHIFIGVGDRMEKVFQKLRFMGYSQESLFHFDSPESAGRMLQEIIRSGDIVLIKGSQGMRMEKVVEEVMAEPLLAPEILCRQSSDWLEKPFNRP